MKLFPIQRTFIYFVRGNTTVQLVSSFYGLGPTKQENMLLFVLSKATESKPVKLETSHTATRPLQCLFSVLCLDMLEFSSLTLQTFSSHLYPAIQSSAWRHLECPRRTDREVLRRRRSPAEPWSPGGCTSSSRTRSDRLRPPITPFFKFKYFNIEDWMFFMKTAIRQQRLTGSSPIS